jgi:hypothetical protein
MDDPNQIEVPPSFLALYTAPSGVRLTEPMALVRERYELCEDVAQSLVDQASMTLHRTGAGEHDVLAAIGRGLTGEGAVVEPKEAVWVARRLAELLGWEDPGDDIADRPTGGGGKPPRS